jgi:hypothetical protein
MKENTGGVWNVSVGVCADADEEQSQASDLFFLKYF